MEGLRVPIEGPGVEPLRAQGRPCGPKGARLIAPPPSDSIALGVPLRAQGRPLRVQGRPLRAEGVALGGRSMLFGLKSKTYKVQQEHKVWKNIDSQRCI